MVCSSISFVQVCVAVLLHSTAGKRKSCRTTPQTSPNKISPDEDGDVVILDKSPVPKRSTKYYDIKTEPPTTQKVRKKKGCCPYEFDSSNCRTVNGRFQCGYDKNLGTVSPDEIPKELPGGCRLRFGRLECGYLYPPYVNERRPLAWDNPPSVIMQPDRRQKLKMAKSGKSPSNSRNGRLFSKLVNTLEMLDIGKEALGLRKSPENSYMRVQQRKEPQGNKVNCVEVDDRIVCKPI